MSLTSAMYTGVSGLLGNSEAMSIIGNNISNVNTAGFKTGRSLFADLLSQKIGTSQVGTGSHLQTVTNDFTQGSLQQTGNVTDLYIAGNSFFALKAPESAAPVATQDAAFLTRAGAFHVDASLTLVNPEGYQVLDTAGNPIRFSDNSAAALGTFKTDYDTVNLPASIAADLAAVTGAAGVDATLLATATSAAQEAATAASGYGAAPSATSAASVASAIAKAYDAIEAANNSASAGAALTTTAASVAALSADAAAVTTAWQRSFGSITKIGDDGLITYAGKDGVTQNYYDASGAVGVAADAAHAATAGRIALVTAVDPTALQKAGGSLYKAGPSSGVPGAAFSLAANKGNGTSEKIVSNALEASNVDMAKEFVSMILTQRAYSASSRTITTADQMTQEVLGLIR